ncbi:hypothetical protein [Streptomyces sp. NPDC001985]|uniref:hypothetical protein n=1 Tax=Streptomyces sp. NPDC001985 TaxID=3154406 RepID=UPI0033340D41
MSVLTLSEICTSLMTSNLAAAQCAIHLVRNPLGAILRRDLVDLPCKAPAALVTCLLPVPSLEIGPARIPARSDGVFQARLAVGRPASSRVILVDLTTASTDLSEEYTEIVLGIGRTLRFTDPVARPTGPRPRSRLSEM